MKKQTIIIVISIIILFFLPVIVLYFVPIDYEEDLYRVKSSNSLDIYSTPSTQGMILGQLHQDQTINVYEVYKGWAKIKYNDNDAYIRMIHIEAVDLSVKETNISASYRVISSESLDVHSIPSTHGMILGQLHQYQTVDVYETRNGWAKIKYNDRDAYIRERHIEVIGDQITPSIKQPSDVVHLFFLVMIVLISMIGFIHLGLYSLNNSVSKFLLSTVFLIEIIYYLLFFFEIGIFHQTEAKWFCNPSTAGLFWAVLNSLIFLILAALQLDITFKFVKQQFNDDIPIIAFVYVAICNFSEIFSVNLLGIPIEILALTCLLIVLTRRLFKIKNKEGFKKGFMYFICIFATSLMFSDAINLFGIGFFFE